MSQQLVCLLMVMTLAYAPEGLATFIIGQENVPVSCISGYCLAECKPSKWCSPQNSDGELKPCSIDEDCYNLQCTALCSSKENFRVSGVLTGQSSRRKTTQKPTQNPIRMLWLEYLAHHDHDQSSAIKYNISKYLIVLNDLFILKYTVTKKCGSWSKKLEKFILRYLL